MSTIFTVAKRAGVSIATVSRVMNDPQKVRERTRLKVEAAMRDLGYSRNAFAASLVTRRSDCVGLVVSNLSGAFFTPLINTVEEVVSASGSYLIVTCGRNSASEVQHALDFMQQRRCDAIILYPSELADQALATILKGNKNLVVIHRTVAGFEERCVQVDNRAGARMATRYLIDCGHREIGVITGPHINPESTSRMASFMETMAAAHLPVPPERVYQGSFSAESGRQGMAELLAANASPSAVFCLNDQMAFGALEYCRECGITVPEKMSVIGFDDVEYANLIHPRLTTIHHPIDALAQAATDIALRLAVGDASLAPQPLLAPKLVIRDSVRKLS